MNLNDYDEKTINKCIKGIHIYNMAMNEFVYKHKVAYEFLYILYIMY